MTALHAMPSGYDRRKLASPDDDEDEMSDADKREASYERGEAMAWDLEDAK